LSVQKHYAVLACSDGKVTVLQSEVKGREVSHMGDEFSLVTVQFKDLKPVLTAGDENSFAPPNRSRYSAK